ncbi:hypothetical protein CVT25_002249 [Psilocybe cyanescens]|uniref:Uncharacterized protein n=1 Tax=Psilocybe cyanescens TaxID=93625 RepID=A0A409X5R0_PSICY|nr:hypothetical protein CVT25_002249 [Psilocybe cyanescens]
MPTPTRTRRAASALRPRTSTCSCTFTVMYGVEKRYRAWMVCAAASATSSAAASRSMSLPPVSGSRVPVVVVEDSDDGFIANVPSTATAASDMKYHRRSSIRIAGASDQSSSRFGRFPLVEDDDISATAKDDSDDISITRAPLPSAGSALQSSKSMTPSTPFA